MNDVLISSVYSRILSNKKEGKKMLAILIDPDKFSSGDIVEAANDAEADLFLVGGSLITNGDFNECISEIKKKSSIPVLIFPGNIMQISNKADGILLLSLISGRNPDMLIGNHVLAAPAIKKSNIEIIPAGYMLIDGGKQTAVTYMSNTMPIPSDKNDIAACTALAGQQLGLQVIYLEAGSGAANPVPEAMIKKVKKTIDVPLFVGGGINDEKKIAAACAAGADVVVVGTAAENNSQFIKTAATIIHSKQ